MPFSPKLLLSDVATAEDAVSSFGVLTGTKCLGRRFKSSLVDTYEMACCTGRGFSFPRKPAAVIRPGV